MKKKLYEVPVGSAFYYNGETYVKGAMSAYDRDARTCPCYPIFFANKEDAFRSVHLMIDVEVEVREK